MLSLKIPSSATVKSTVKASLADKYMSAVIAAMSAVFAFLFLYLTALALLMVFENYFIIVAVSVAIFAILLAQQYKQGLHLELSSVKVSKVRLPNIYP